MWSGAHEARLFRVWCCGRRRIYPRFRRRRCAPASRRQGWWALPSCLPPRRICAIEHALKGTARHTPPYPCPGLWGDGRRIGPLEVIRVLHICWGRVIKLHGFTTFDYHTMACFNLRPVGGGIILPPGYSRITENKEEQPKQIKNIFFSD